MGEDAIKLTMQVLISLALLAAGLYVLLWASASDELQKVAAGWIGAVVGYWPK